MTRSIRRAIPRVLTATVLLLLMSTSVPAAIKLVRMNNGRTLKARTVERDGDWLFATLEGGSTIGFPMETVASVEDDPLGRDDLGTPSNVVTSGRDIGRSSFRANNSRRQANQQPPPVQQDEPEEAPDAQEASPQPGVNGNVAPQLPGRTVSPGQQQQLPGSRFNRLGLRSRNGDN